MIHRIIIENLFQNHVRNIVFLILVLFNFICRLYFFKCAFSIVGDDKEYASSDSITGEDLAEGVHLDHLFGQMGDDWFPNDRNPFVGQIFENIVVVVLLRAKTKTRSISEKKDGVRKCTISVA